ncbi:hypothetical protein, partial [Arthrobacter sp. DR-2P]
WAVAAERCTGSPGTPGGRPSEPCRSAWGTSWTSSTGGARSVSAAPARSCGPLNCAGNPSRSSGYWRPSLTS